MTAFHFSPRPNRAHEIHWQEWSADAFAQAKQQGKPLLLGISAVWCHWCHVMDETTYSDERVISTINSQFVPVRVDNDVRPDINARYNMGGWPTTVFLTSDGGIIAGATYLPPDQMQRALHQITTFYAENETGLQQKNNGSRQQHIDTTVSTETPDQNAVLQLNFSIIEHVINQLKNAYDPLYGGFGDSQKFPQPEALALLLQEYRVDGEKQLLDMLVTTLRNMSTSGTYDHVEGGFFRYSTTRDWSIPHFEKMTEDHAGILRVLADLSTLVPERWIMETLHSATAYIRNVLRDEVTGFFAGSQDADEAYFSKSLEERRTMQPPYVDRRSYSNWTATLGGTFFILARAFDHAGDRAMALQLSSEAQTTLDALYDRTRDSSGLLFHLTLPSGERSIRGLLTDQVAFIRALVDAYEYTNETRFLERAIAHADVTITHFAAPDGGFYDLAIDTSDGGRVGNLTITDRPIVENGLLAEALLRLALLSGATHFHSVSVKALLVYTETYQRAGTFGATYARAIRRYLTPALCTERGCI